jgi:hypothetical protein
MVALSAGPGRSNRSATSTTDGYQPTTMVRQLRWSCRESIGRGYLLPSNYAAARTVWPGVAHHISRGGHKFGTVLLVLGVLHLFNVFVLNRIRRRTVSAGEPQPPAASTDWLAQTATRWLARAQAAPRGGRQGVRPARPPARPVGPVTQE